MSTSGLWGDKVKPIVYLTWAVTLATGFVILGGLGALQSGAPNKIVTVSLVLGGSL